MTNSNAFACNSFAGHGPSAIGRTKVLGVGQNVKQQGVVLAAGMGHQRLERRLDRRLIVVGGERAGEHLFERAAGHLAAVAAQRFDDRLDQLRQIGRIVGTSAGTFGLCGWAVGRRRLSAAERKRPAFGGNFGTWRPGCPAAEGGGSWPAVSPAAAASADRSSIGPPANCRDASRPVSNGHQQFRIVFPPVTMIGFLLPFGHVVGQRRLLLLLRLFLLNILRCGSRWNRRLGRLGRLARPATTSCSRRRGGNRLRHSRSRFALLPSPNQTKRPTHDEHNHQHPTRRPPSADDDRSISLKPGVFSWTWISPPGGATPPARPCGAFPRRRRENGKKWDCLRGKGSLPRECSDSAIGEPPSEKSEWTVARAKQPLVCHSFPQNARLCPDIAGGDSRRRLRRQIGKISDGSRPAARTRLVPLGDAYPTAVPRNRIA